VIRGGFLTTTLLETNGVYNPNVILLPNVKSLEIVVNEFSYPFYLPLTIRLRDPERAAENDRQFNEMAAVVAQNIAFILDTLKCPKLKMFQVYSYQKISFLLPLAINWRSGPLERFLEYHRETLRELYLPEFEGKHSWYIEERPYPVSLSKLCIMLSQYIGDREDSRQQDVSYWRNLLSDQRNLKAIDLQTYDLQPEWFLEVVSSFCTNSKAHLTFIDFVNQTEDQFVLDCEIFSVCTCLQVLKFACRETEAVVSNLTKLPKCLRKIRIHSCYVQPPTPDEIPKFTNLVMLEIDSLIAEEMPHERALTAILALLKLRNLNYLGITFDQTVGESEEFRRTIENFSLYWDPRFRYTSIKINFEYELVTGWSEEVFDETRNDRDGMGYREPEDLSSWHSSVSGFEDDDPRVMIFHHLPLIIDGGAEFFIEGITDDDDVSERPELDDETPSSFSEFMPGLSDEERPDLTSASSDNYIVLLPQLSQDPVEELPVAPVEELYFDRVEVPENPEPESPDEDNL